MTTKDVAGWTVLKRYRPLTPILPPEEGAAALRPGLKPGFQSWKLSNKRFALKI
jgi:hypothetical protein